MDTHESMCISTNRTLGRKVIPREEIGREKMDRDFVTGGKGRPEFMVSASRSYSVVIILSLG